MSNNYNVKAKRNIIKYKLSIGPHDTKNFYFILLNKKIIKLKYGDHIIYILKQIVNYPEHKNCK